MVGGAIQRVVMQKNLPELSGPQPLWQNKGLSRTDKVRYVLTAPSSLSRATVTCRVSLQGTLHDQ